MKSVLEVPCKVQLHGSFNESKGLVYMQEFDISKDTIVESFKAGLVKRYDIKEVVPASWIVPKSSYRKPFFLTFKRSIPPAFIEVPGEAENIKVYQYKQKPLFCTNCPENTHSKRNCKNSKRCQLCSECHADQQFTKTAAKCYHCKQDHKVHDPRCPMQQQEEEICDIQSKEKIPWRLARQKYFTQRPDGAKSYAEATRISSKEKPQRRDTAKQSENDSENMVKVCLRKKTIVKKALMCCK